jgi:TonB family protein
MYKYLLSLVVFLGCTAYAQDTPPIISASNCQKPSYPAQSKRLEEEGTVTLKFLIGTDAEIKEGQIEKTSGFKRLDETALIALGKCKFQPAYKSGLPIEGWAAIKFTFKLEDSAYNIKPSVYKVSDLNGLILKNLSLPKIKFVDFKGLDSINLNCRMTKNSIFYTEDRIGIEKFIENAFNSEIKASDAYSNDGINITAMVQSIDVSTYMTGYWNFRLAFKTDNGSSMTNSHKFEFPATFKAAESCPSAAIALPAALQQFIYKTLASKEFSDFLSKSSVKL